MRGKRGVFAVTFSVVKNAPGFGDLFFWLPVSGRWSCLPGTKAVRAVARMPTSQSRDMGHPMQWKVAGLLVQQFVRLEACC